jgi:hypothetical protein
VAAAFRYRLLFIGANHVPGGTWLHAPARDARAFSDRFRGWGYDAPGSHRLLVQQEANRPRIVAELGRAIAQPDLDLLLIYWAGHLSGTARHHALATNGDVPGTPGEPLGLEMVTSALGLAPGVRHRILILDACNAIAARSELAAVGRHVSRDECAAVFAAGGDEHSREALRRGHFTGALLEQLPPGARGVPPKGDLLQALKTGAEHLVARRREQPFIGVYGSAEPLILPEQDDAEPAASRRARVVLHPSARAADTRRRA